MQGISDIITIPGLVNVDFADVKAIMCNSGTAMLGVGVSSGKSRAEEAAMVRVGWTMGGSVWGWVLVGCGLGNHERMYVWGTGVLELERIARIGKNGEYEYVHFEGKMGMGKGRENTAGNCSDIKTRNFGSSCQPIAHSIGRQLLIFHKTLWS